MRKASILTAMIATSALLGAEAAQAQAACTSEEEMSALAIYAVPSLVSAVETRCGAELSPTGYLAQSGTAFADRYSARRDTVWPLARNALFRFAANGAGEDAEMVELFEQLPPDAVQPLIDAVIIQKVAAEIDPSSCSTIERGMEVIDPVEPEEAGAIIAFIVVAAAPEELAMCPAEE